MPSSRCRSRGLGVQCVGWSSWFLSFLDNVCCGLQAWGHAIRDIVSFDMSAIALIALLKKSVVGKYGFATGESTWIERQMVRRFLEEVLWKVRRTLAFRQPSFDDPRRDLCPRGKAQLPQDIAHMPFGGSFAYHQEISNLPARFALSNECWRLRVHEPLNRQTLAWQPLAGVAVSPLGRSQVPLVRTGHAETHHRWSSQVPR